MAVTEQEIINRMGDCFRVAAECCDDLAVLPARGPTYDRLRKELALIEGCCRQLAYYRNNDARWLSAGLAIEEAHKRAGGWLREHPRTATANPAHPLFVLLAAKLRDMHKRADALRDNATGRVGAILPALAKVTPENRMVQVPSGLFVPAEFAA